MQAEICGGLLWHGKKRCLHPGGRFGSLQATIQREHPFDEKLRLVIMHALVFKKVYSLGKNHMQPLKDRSAFDFSQMDSHGMHLPLPNHAVAYKELELIDSFKEGIHCLLIFRINKEEKLVADPETLAHIHSIYATWRENNGLRGNYLLR